MTSLSPAPALRAWPQRLPAPTFWGFLALLAVLFAAAYCVGSAVGPVSPGLRPVNSSGSSGASGASGASGSGQGSGGSGGMPGMGGSGEMPGMGGMGGGAAR